MQINLEKIIIKNRKDQNVSVLLEQNKNQKGLAFVMHGLGGFKEQNHIKTFALAFREKGFTIVRFDTTNTYGESYGKYEDATITNYYEDLEDVIQWASKQVWYQEKFVLSGHSLGGICILLYAEKYPEKVMALAPISAVVSGKLSVEAHERCEPENLKLWKETGWIERNSQSKPNIVKRLPWSHIEDRLKYDTLPEVNKLTMPVLLITGENDVHTPPDHIQLLFDVLPGKKEMHIIKDAPHTFCNSEHLKQIENIFSNWINSF